MCPVRKSGACFRVLISSLCFRRENLSENIFILIKYDTSSSNIFS
uniref:Uncharacterized protein n=1 Tax=Lepeophtheirus salmonis TaxID=72036 RepID=A0A0K2UBL8_LEPSM